MKIIHKIKNNQTRYLSKTWHQQMVKRQVIRNNFLVTGSIQKAKEFAKTLAQFQTQEIDIYRRETLIFPATLLN